MSRMVKIAVLQPPYFVENAAPDSIERIAIDLLEEAAKDNADIICLPEYLNCMSCNAAEVSERSGAAVQMLLKQIASLADKYNSYIIAPVVIDTELGRFNRSVIFDRQGNQSGHYDKVHITHIEREEWGVKEGNVWPVFSCDFGHIGIMTCYDGCFVEPARILALKGAEIVFWPSLQRSFTADEPMLQTRAHAYFNHVVVARSSYGTEKDQAWQPGKIVGMGCVCGFDGTILSNLGRWSGWTSAGVDLDNPQRALRSFGGDEEIVRQMRLEDRRPKTYKEISF